METRSLSAALRKAAPGPQALGWALAAVIAAAAVSVVLGGASSAPPLALMALLAAASAVLLTRQLCRPLLAAMFFLAPIDLSKALIASPVSRFYPSGPYFSPGLYVLLSQLALLGLFAVWLGRRLFIEHRAPPLTALDALAFCYLAVIWLRSLGTPQGMLSIATAASYTLAVLGFYVASHAVRNAGDLRVALGASVVVLAITLLFVAAQFVTQSPLTLPGSKGLAAGATVSLGESGEVFRPPGLMNHPNSLAHYLVIVLPIAVALVLAGPRRISGATWWLAVSITVAGGAALLVTLSRGGWAAGLLATVTVVVLYVWRGLIGARQLAAMAVAALVALVGVLIAYPSILLRLTAPDGRSLESRGLLANMAYTIIRANPWAGVGFGDFNRAAFAYSAPLYANVSEDYQFMLHQLVVHNHYLLIAAELGIPAMLLFVYLLWRFIRQVAPLKRWPEPFSFALAAGLTGGLAGQALFLASDNYYTDIRIALLWLSAGMLQSLVLRAERETLP